MKKLFLLQGIITALVFVVGGCASNNDDYCCVSNDQCGSVHGKDTFCTTDECGQCKAPDNPLQIVANSWKDAVVGKPYEVELDASGGFSPYDWVELSKAGDIVKLTWLVLEEDPDDPSKAYLRNVNDNGQLFLPATPTGAAEELTIKVTVRDNTQHGDSGGVVFNHTIKINECGEASDCKDLPGDAACVDAACNAGKCEYSLKSTDTECLAGGCRDGFIYAPKKCNDLGNCVTPIPNGVPCYGYQCADTTSCKTSCSVKEDCAGALLCKNDNTCISPQALGATCTVDGECLSNHCANNVCCESACNGPCQACGGGGQCNLMPTDDSRCAEIDCSSLDTIYLCRTYSDLKTNRCASFGVCKDSSSCIVFIPKPTTTVCNASTNECDPAEYCDSDGDCPTDSFKADGTSCSSDNGKCFTGACDLRGACTCETISCGKIGCGGELGCLCITANINILTNTCGHFWTATPIGTCVGSLCYPGSCSCTCQ